MGKAYSDQNSILKMPITCLQANMVEALPQWGKHSQHKVIGANQIWSWYNYNSWPQNLDDTTTQEVEKWGHWIIISLKWRAIKVSCETCSLFSSVHVPVITGNSKGKEGGNLLLCFIRVEKWNVLIYWVKRSSVGLSCSSHMHEQHRYESSSQGDSQRYAHWEVGF